jgi:hypothetical protein
MEKRLIVDGQQFHLWLTQRTLNKKKTRHVTLKIPVLAYDRHDNVVCLNPLMNPLLDNWISNDNTDIDKQLTKLVLISTYDH